MAHAAIGRIGRPAFPAPSDEEGGTSRQDSRETCGEIATLWLLLFEIRNRFSRHCLRQTRNVCARERSDEAMLVVIPGRCTASNPESRDSPMRNCASEV